MPSALAQEPSASTQPATNSSLPHRRTEEDRLVGGDVETEEGRECESVEGVLVHLVSFSVHFEGLGMSRVAGGSCE